MHACGMVMVMCIFYWLPCAQCSWYGYTLDHMQARCDHEGFTFVRIPMPACHFLCDDCSDREGVAPLFWGATGTGQLMFGSLLADLTECDPTATAFPAGCLFTR
jgi:hypothetical protein